MRSFKLPYPLDNDSPAILFNRIVELRAFVFENYDWYVKSNRRLEVNASETDLRNDPYVSNATLTSFCNLPVLDLYIAWGKLREIRELYDRVVRAYEHEWESDRATVLCMLVYARAHYVLANVFLPNEVREARDEEGLGNSRTINALSDIFKKPKNQADDIDVLMDQLFNEPDNQ